GHGVPDALSSWRRYVFGVPGTKVGTGRQLTGGALNAAATIDRLLLAVNWLSSGTVLSSFDPTESKLVTLTVHVPQLSWLKSLVAVAGSALNLCRSRSSTAVPELM